MSGGCATPSVASPSTSPPRDPRLSGSPPAWPTGSSWAWGSRRMWCACAGTTSRRARGRRGAGSRTSTCGGSSRPMWREAARRRWSPSRWRWRLSANHAFRFTLEGKGLDPDLHEQVRGLAQRIRAPPSRGPGCHAQRGDMTDRWGLTDYLADRFANRGHAGGMRRRRRGAAAAAGRPSSSSRASSR